MCDDRPGKAAQQRVEIQFADQAQEQIFGYTDHDRLTRPCIDMVFQFQDDWLALQQAAENSGSTAPARIAAGAACGAAETYAGTVLDHIDNFSLLLDHAGRVNGQWETSSTASAMNLTVIAGTSPTTVTRISSLVREKAWVVPRRLIPVRAPLSGTGFST